MRVHSVAALLRPLAALVLVAALGGSSGSAQAAHSDRLSEVRFDELMSLPQWQEVARALPREAALVRACLKGHCSNAGAVRMAAYLSRGMRADAGARLRSIHQFVNRQPYREDLDQFDEEDRWQTPLTFAMRGGDCEDFAIAKYFLLRLLGVPAADLRVTVLTGRDRSEVHAVLLARLSGEWLVLDNRLEEPRPLQGYEGWILQYGVSEAGGFRYGPAQQVTPRPLQFPANR
jgi:predicted transglutaminase-like cysteine proteinase